MNGSSLLKLNRILTREAGWAEAQSETPASREITSTEPPPEVQAKAKELKDACFPGDTPIIVEKGHDRGDCQVLTFESIWMWVAMMVGISDWEECPEISLEETGIDLKVLSRDERTGEMAYKRILKMFNHGYRNVNHIRCKYGPKFRENCGNAQGLFATDEHPFWVQGKGWTQVCDLQPGDEFITYNGDPTIVEKVEPKKAPSMVFNMAVEDFHTYFVDVAGIWVHNTNCAKKVANKETALERSIENQLAREKLPCFVAGTLVYTKDGLKPIEEIRVGDWVLSFPDDQVPPLRFREENGERWFIPRQEDEYTYRQVTRTFVHEDKPICEVEVIDFANGIEKLKVTLDHPFYVRHKGWMPASEMNYRCALYNQEFANLMVGRVSVTGECARVYNLEVDEFHTYYVGRLRAWVHNTCELTRLQQA
ncbi:MAG: HINT domain-containing protein [Zoogloeaceae bacterium]|jgi:hypothetical protein|nr:HINT domain-containing protein [Zoogloeaceae bacterium]